MIKPKTTNILGIEVSITNMKDSINYIVDNLEILRGEYVCFTNVHTTVMAYNDSSYCNIQNSAYMALPDGRPLHRVQKKRGFKNAEQVAGPDFMPNFWKKTENTGIKHYFYGSSPETIGLLEKNLKQKYPNLKIVGFESPPYRELTEEEDREVVERINEAGADVVWVGLGAPKQEKWMYQHKGKINAVMFGVGAGFDFHAGIVKRAPKWMRDNYLEWLYRLCQDPKRLLKRYFVTNTVFLYLIKKRR